MKAREIIEQLRMEEAYHDDPHNPEARKRQLAARPPGYQTTMLRRRIEKDTADTLDAMKRKHAAGAGGAARATV